MTRLAKNLVERFFGNRENKRILNETIHSALLTVKETCDGILKRRNTWLVKREIKSAENFIQNLCTNVVKNNLERRRKSAKIVIKLKKKGVKVKGLVENALDIIKAICDRIERRARRNKINLLAEIATQQITHICNVVHIRL